MEASAGELEPHRMAYYLRELAGMVHPFYNKHRILPPAPDSEPSAAILPDSAPTPNRGTDTIPPGLTGARLALMWAVQQVVRNGLNVLGVSAPEQM
jgi:arginyl-tRNA synthetase